MSENLQDLSDRIRLRRELFMAEAAMSATISRARELLTPDRENQAEVIAVVQEVVEAMKEAVELSHESIRSMEEG